MTRNPITSRSTYKVVCVFLALIYSINPLWSTCDLQPPVIDQQCLDHSDRQTELVVQLFGERQNAHEYRTLSIVDPMGNPLIEKDIQLSSFGHWVGIINVELITDGTYTLSYSCDDGSSEMVSFDVQTQPIYSYTVSPITCAGMNDAEIQIIPHRSQQLNYTWSDGSTAETRSNMLPGTYILQVSNQQGCISTERFVITEPESLTVDLNAGIFDCYGQMDSLVVLNITGGTPPYAVDWSYDGMGDFDDPDRLTDMQEGMYTLEVMDDHGCIRNFQVIIDYDSLIHPVHAKSVNLKPKFIDGGIFVYELDEALNVQNGDVDDDGEDGSIFEVGYYASMEDAMQDTNPMSEMYKSDKKDTIYTRIETSSRCFVVSTIQLLNDYFCIPQSELCDSDPPLLLTPTECDVMETPLPDGGTYEAFLDNNGVLTPIPDLISCDPTTGECYLDPDDAEGSYQINYTYFNGTSLETRTALFNIQAVNPSIVVGFDSICGNYPIFSLRVNPIGGSFNGPGIVDSLRSGLNQFYFIDPSLLDHNEWNRYVYKYSGTQGSGLICDKVREDSLFAATPVYVDVLSNTITSCSLSTVTFLTANVRGLIQNLEWYDPNNRLLGYGPSLTIRGELEGRYKVRAVGQNGCLDSAYVDVTLLELPQLNCSIDASVSCPGGSDANIEVEIEGVSDLTGYSIQWDNGPTTFSQSGVSAGMYRAVVTAPNGCIDSCDVIVTEPDVIEIECDHVQQPVTCHGGSDGVDSISVTGGTPPYMYSLDGINFQNSPVLMNVPGGENKVYILDSNDCLDSCSFSMPEPPEFFCSSRVSSSISCHDALDGQITVSPVGGNAPYTFLWNTGDTTAQITGLGPGTYEVQVRDSKDCLCEETITLMAPPELTISVENDTVDCFLDTNGSLTVDVSGGTPPYSYNWFNGHSQGTISNLGAGTYQVEVTDANGCIEVTTGEIIQPTGIQIFCTQDFLDCHGDTDGSLSVTAIGGTPPYSYLWSDGQTTQTAVGLPAGGYELRVMDSNGCEAICSSEVVQPLQLSIDLQEDSVCLDFAKTIPSLVNGGIPGYIYEWTLLDPGTTEATMNNLENPDQSELRFNSFDLKPGTVVLGLKVIDGNGCESFEQVNFELACCFDLALQKTVINPFDYMPGQNVNFDLEVINQGVIDAFDLVITDTFPDELLFNGAVNTSIVTGNPYDWIEAKTNVIQTQIDHVPAGGSVFLDVNFTVDPAFTGFELINYAGITNYSNAVKNLPIDQDDAPVLRLSLERNNDISDEHNGGSDTPEDEDRFDFEAIYFCSTAPFACNDLVQISLDENGQVQVTPDMVAEGLQSLAFITLEIRDENGNDIGTNLNCSYIGQLLEYSVHNGCDSSSCWGNIILEDKMPPQVQCAIPDTFYCHQNPINLRPDTVTDNCSSSWTEEVVFDEKYTYPCDSAMACKQVIGKVYIDSSGNRSDICYKEIYFKRYHINDIDFPGDTLINCTDFISADPDAVGVPTVDGDPIYPMDLGCSVALKYSDDTLFSCGSTFKIIRTWTAVDWCPVSSERIFKHKQIIKTVDLDGPIVYCPGTDALVDTFSSDENCQGTFILPVPKVLSPGEPIVDSTHVYIISECSDFTYTVQHLPAENPFDCTPSNQLPSDDQIRDLGNGTYEAVDLPYGCNWFYYEITDACGNSTTCTFDVFVKDMLPPVAICDEHTTVSLTLSGLAELPATSLDAGSYDNCQMDTMLVRRLDGPNCGFSADWRDVATFCCEDVGDTIMVELGIWDASNNFNSCMIEVFVQNKTAPILVSCPDDITILCTQDYRDTSLTGGRAYFEGVCPVVVTYEDFPQLDACGLGTVRRVWTAEDVIGNSVLSCEQLITVIDPNPITQNNIIWPRSVVTLGTGCNDDTNPAITGEPSVRNANCHDILMTYSDQELVREQGSCLKILRKWTVVDWCQFDLVTRKGQWTFDQTIVVKNQSPPRLDCRDTTHFIYTDQCEDQFQLTISATDDCTDFEDLNWKIEVDQNGDGSIDMTTQNINQVVTLTPGIHLVHYTVEDGCGNTDKCTREIHMVDGKEPSPVCKDAIVTVIMSVSGSIEVWASDLNDKSFDNCTPEDELIYSFSPDTSDQVRIYDCDSLPNGVVDTFQIEIWVTDQAGNQDYCLTEIVIQDNAQDACPDSSNLTSTLTGAIQMLSGIPKKDMPVECVFNQGGMMRTVSDQQGQYQLSGLRPGMAYELSAQYFEDYLEGISTKDLILIQNHLLGKKSFDQWHQWLAADVDGSGSVSARDIVSIRKVLLGKTEVFPNGMPSWMAIQEPDSDQQAEPFAIPFIHSITGDHDQQIDWVSYKLGDVDASSAGLNQNGTRSNETWEVYWEKGEQSWQLRSAEDRTISGFQMSLTGLEGPLNITGESISIGLENWSQWNDMARLSWHSLEPVQIKQGEILFAIDNDHRDIQLDPNWLNEAYDETLKSLEIQWSETDRTSKSFNLYQNIPNPFDASTVIPFEMYKDGQVRLSIFNAEGRLIHAVQGYYASGNHELYIQSGDLNQTGVMYYRMQVGDEVEMKKMVRL